ncbi:MAG: radical SAM protein [Candidatus Micrarchaeota archaeon]|nr:radical SAM protein [Candidatus Micrarchaeota archaeon]
MEVAKTLGIAATGLQSNFGRLSKPYKLNFAITFWCQSRCVMCNIWDIKPKGELSLDEIKEFAAKNSYFKWVQLTGGEPFLRSDIVEVARAFKETSKGLYMLTMPTNSLCNLDMEIKKITEMLELGIPKIAITVSLDGFRELHDSIRGIPGNYDRAIALFKRLRELKKTHPNLFFVFGYTIIKQNQGQFQKTFESVKMEIPDITYNDFHINLGQMSENYYHTTDGGILVDNRNSLSDEIASVVSKRKRDLNPIQIIEDTFLKGLVNYAKTGKVPMRSRSLDASLYLDSWGNVYPSIMWNKRIGNIREVGYDLGKIWKGKEAEEARREIREGREPVHWTSCEAYQTIIGNMASFVTIGSKH